MEAPWKKERTPTSFSSTHGTPSEDLPMHTCWIALVFSIFDPADFIRITAIALTLDHTVLLTLASAGAVWSYPGLPSLHASCGSKMLPRCSALQCNRSSITKVWGLASASCLVGDTPTAQSESLGLGIPVHLSYCL